MILNQKTKESELITNLSSSEEKKSSKSKIKKNGRRISKRRQIKRKCTTKIINQNINFAIMICNLKKVKIQNYEISSQYPTIDKLMNRKGKSLKVENNCKEFSLIKIHCKKNNVKKKNLNGFFFIRKRGKIHKFLDDLLN